MASMDPNRKHHLDDPTKPKSAALEPSVVRPCITPQARLICNLQASSRGVCGTRHDTITRCNATPTPFVFKVCHHPVQYCCRLASERAGAAGRAAYVPRGLMAPCMSSLSVLPACPWIWMSGVLVGGVRTCHTDRPRATTRPRTRSARASQSFARPYPYQLHSHPFVTAHRPGGELRACALRLSSSAGRARADADADGRGGTAHGRSSLRCVREARQGGIGKARAATPSASGRRQVRGEPEGRADKRDVRRPHMGKIRGGSGQPHRRRRRKHARA
jgi:hypothetical protein